MKIVLTGATGLIGSCALESALAHPEITHVVSLQRRMLDADSQLAKSPKLEQVIVRDFARYEGDVLERIKGAEACIWCMGNFAQYAKVGREEVMRVNKDYPEAFLLQAALPTAQANASGSARPFRFVFIGGIIMSRDQDASLWILSSMRKEAGLILQNAFEIAAPHPSLQVLLQHPGMNWFLRAEYIGAVLTEMALRGTQRSPVGGEDEVWNSTTIEWGRRLVEERQRGGAK